MHAATTIAARRATGGTKLLRLLAPLLFVVTILSPSLVAAQGGPQCPLQVFSGNFQAGDPNEVIDLTVQQTFSTATPPPSESFTWRITSGTARFANTGGAQQIQTQGAYVDQGSGLFDAFGTARLVLGDDPSQTIVVEAQSSSCASQGAPPAQFFEFVNFSSQSGELIALAGDGVTGRVGDSVALAVRVTEPCFGPSRMPRRGGGYECPVDVTFTVVSGSAQFSDGRRITTVTTDATDTARVGLVLGPQPGPITVRASASGYEPIQLALRATRERTLVAIGGATRSGSPGAPGELEVQLLEAGQPVAGETIVFQATFGQAAVLGSNSDVTDDSGVAKVPFTFSQQPGTGLVDARAAGGENVVFSIRSQLGGLALVSGGGQTGPTNGEPADPFVFVLQDQGGAPLAGEVVAFSVASGNGTVTPASAVTDAQGRAQTRLRFGPTPGTVVVQASAFGGQAIASGTATAFAPVLAGSSGDNQTAPAGTTLPQPLVVQLGQPPTPGKSLGGVPVNWSVAAGGGSLAAATTFTDASGRASNELTLGPTPGTNTVQANVQGGGSVTFNATATAPTGGTGVTLQIASGNNQALPTFTDSAPLVVRAVNSQGAPVANVRIVWTPIVSGTVAVTPTTSTTDSSGQASTVARVLLPGAQEVAAAIENAPGATSVRFTLNGGVENVPSLDAGEASVGGAIDAACPALFAQSQGGALESGASDLLQRCSELVVASGNNPGSVQQALDQMVADEALAQGTAAITTTATQFDNLKARLAALRSGARGIDLNGLALAGANGALPLSFLPSTLLMQDDAGGSDEAGAAFSRWGFFATGTVGRGNQDAAGAEPGFDFDTYGLTAGIDYRVNDDFVIGAALGYNNNDTQIDGDQGGLDTKGWNLSGYGSWYKDAWYFDGVITWGSNDYDLTRRIRYSIANLAGGSTTVDQVASASPGSDQLAFALSVGRDFNRGAWSFGPYARATYTRLDFDGYTERLSDPNGPGGGLAVAVDGRELKSLEGVLGGKATYTSSRSWGILMPSIQVEWLHEFEDDVENLVSRFVNDPTGTPIVVPGEPVDADYFNLGLGLSAVFANGKSGFIYYEHRAGQKNFTQDSLAIGVRIEF